MVTLSDIRDAYEKAVRGHESSSDYINFAINEEYNLMKLLNDITTRTFTPHSYAFIKKTPRPREVFGCFEADRIVHYLIDKDLRPLVESRLTNCTYNNRIGYGTINAVLKVVELTKEVSDNFTKDAYYIKLDYSGFFPNANMNIVHSKLVKLIDESYKGDDIDQLKYLLRTCLLTNPTKNCEIRFDENEYKLIEPYKSIFTKPDGIGAAIGYLINQLAMNYYVNDIDVFLVNKGVLFVRFVDDLLIVTTNKSNILNLIPTIRSMSSQIGCELSKKKFYCQHISKGVEFLGYHIKLNRIHLNNRIYARWIHKLEGYNRKPELRKVFKFQATMNSYLGMTKITNDDNKVNQIITKVNSEWYQWINFNSKRRCFQLKPEYNISSILDYLYHYKLA